MRANLGILLVAGCALGGCAASVHPVPTTVATPGIPNAEEALLQSMHHVDAEMAELGQYQPSQVAASTSVVPADLQRTVSFTWNGPLDQGVAKLAQSVGYTFYVTAPPDAKPLLVNLAIGDVTAYRVFQALGEQAGTQATVEVDPLHHRVQVIHHG